MSQAVPPGRKRLEPELRRGLILDAAIEVLSAQGLQASVGDVASAAGVTRTVVYHYFGSRSALVIEALGVATRDMLGALSEGWGSGGSEAERMREAVLRLFAAIEPRRTLWLMLFDYQSSLEPEIERHLTELREGFIAAALLLSEEAQRARGFEPGGRESRAITEMLIGSMVGLVRWWTVNPGQAPEWMAALFAAVGWGGVSRLHIDQLVNGADQASN